MHRQFLALACLLVGFSAWAEAPQRKEAQPRAAASTKAGSSGKSSSGQKRGAPCQPQTPDRYFWPQGTHLWGTWHKASRSETSSVLTSVDLSRVRMGGTTLRGAHLEEGHLVVPLVASKSLAGAVLRGTDSDGQPVDVALCSAEPAADDPATIWYQIEVWDAESAKWKSPCIATGSAPTPRALAVPGVWDGRGARHDIKGKFTFACENGAIAKCIEWGYKPWAEKDGRSLKELHQACTRMARADYCGDGRSHTRENNAIDVYDGFNINTRTTEALVRGMPEKASFEAAWAPDGASCLARTRDGQAVKAIMEQCPDRFALGERDLGQGDRCTVVRQGARTKDALLRNHSYGKSEQGGPSTASVSSARGMVSESR